MDTPNAKMRRRRDRPFRDFDALRTSSRQGGSSVGASVPMMSVETATSAPEVDVAAPGAIRSRTRSCLGAVFGVTSQHEKGLSEQRSSNLTRRCTRSKTRKSLFARNYVVSKKRSTEAAPRAWRHASEPLQRNQLLPAHRREAQRGWYTDVALCTRRARPRKIEVF